MPKPQETLRGFTLVQAGTALLIAAIAFAIAVPVYHSRGLHRRRAEAIAGLTTIQAAEEQFYLRHSRYAADLAALGLSPRTPRGAYALSLEVNDAVRPSAFTARALAVESEQRSADPRCARFSLNQNGVRGADDASGADRTNDCWR